MRTAITHPSITHPSIAHPSIARLTIGGLATAALLALAGCAAGGTTAADTRPQAESAAIESPWVKTADSGMSAGFGTLTNDSDHDITVVSVASPASPMMELHETVPNEAGQTVMREVEGGFVIPAQGSLALEPGGNHIMMMELPEPVRAGDEVRFTLTFSDDSTLEYTALAKDYAGANENYDGDDAPAGGEHAGMDMSHGAH